MNFFTLQVVRHTEVRPLPDGHLTVRAGDASPGHGVPRAVFQLRRVRDGADQGRSVRDARRRGVLPAPLPAVRVRGVAVVVLVARAAGPAAVAVAAAAAAEDRHAARPARRPVAVPAVPGARGRRARVLQRLGRVRRR